MEFFHSGGGFFGVVVVGVPFFGELVESGFDLAIGRVGAN